MKENELHIVTGANGRVGYPLCMELRKRGLAVRALYRTDDFIVKKLRELGCETVRCDIMDTDGLNKALSGGTYVYHLAGVVSIESKINKRIEKVNVGGMENVINACLRQRVRRLIHTGSVHALDAKGDKDGIIREPARFDPARLSGAYSVSKARGCNLVLDAVRGKGLDAVIVLPSGIIGPFDYKGSNFGEAVAQVIERKLRVYFKGRYDFVDVRDVATAMADVAKKGERGEIYTVSGNIVTIKNLLNIVAEEAKVPKIKFSVPLFLVKMFAGVSEAVALRKNRTPMVTPYSIKVLQDNCNFSHEKLTNLTGYAPMPAEDSLREHAKFYMENIRKI